MFRTATWVGAIALCCAAAHAEEKKMSLYDLETKTLEGKPMPLSAYRGKVTLMVNTASECGYTPQYEGLQKLHQELAAKGFSVVGLPSNDFGGQEPGDAKQIRVFCTTKYKVEFPLTEKVKTKGEGQHPIYAFLAAKHGEPKWNFHKYLIGKDGQVLGAYSSKVAPDSPELKKAIEEALKK
jgi:glutathione peroxidase